MASCPLPLLVSELEALEALGRTCDGLGLGLDTEILRPVAALNAVGVTTDSSCAGHLDRALSYPWIGVGVQLPPHPPYEGTISSQQMQLAQLHLLLGTWNSRRPASPCSLVAATIGNYGAVRVVPSRCTMRSAAPQRERPEWRLDDEPWLAPSRQEFQEFATWVFDR